MDPKHKAVPEILRATRALLRGWHGHALPPIVDLRRRTPQHRATGFVICTRLFNAKPVELGHAGKADGRWRLCALAATTDHPGNTDAGIDALCKFQADESPVRMYAPAGKDVDAVFDLRAVYRQGHRELDYASMPALVCPPKGRHGLLDYETALCVDVKKRESILDLPAIKRARGALVVVRPEQHIAHAWPLDAHKELAEFFSGIMQPCDAI